MSEEMPRRALTALSAAKMPRGASRPSFSPDGRFLLYEEGPETCIWEIVRRRSVVRFRGHDAVWSAHGECLAFECNGQIFVASRDSSGARCVGAGAGPQWHPTGTMIYWIEDEDGKGPIVRADVESMRAPEQIAQSAQEHPWAISPDGQRLAYVHVEPNATRLSELPEFVVQIGSFPGRPELCVIDLTNGRSFVVDRLPPGAEVTGLAWSSDSRTLGYDWELLFDSPGPVQRQTRLWQPGASRPTVVEVGESVSTSRLSWSPDGGRLALLANPWGHFTSDGLGWLTVFDVNKKTVCWECREVIGTTAPIWAPDGRVLYCRVPRHTGQPYVAISAEGNSSRDLTPAGHYCSAAALSPDGGHLTVSARSFSGLNEIWLCPTKDGSPTCITSASQILDELALSRVWTHHWTSADGLPLEGIVIESGGESSAGAPILLFSMVNERGWNIVCLEPEANLGFLAHWMAQCGYRVFIPSHRLTGLVALQYLRDQFRPFDAVADIVSGVCSLRERLGDEAPVVAFGQSGGGDLVCEIVTSYPDVLAAAVVSGIQPDFASLYSIEATRNPILEQTFGGPPWHRPREYLEASPIRGVARVRAPILILMGSSDTSCPNAERFYVGLSEAGRDVTYLQFQGQDHWPEEPERVAAYVETAIRWLSEKLAPSRGQEL